MKNLAIVFLSAALILGACTSTQINQTLGGINDALGNESLTTEQVVAGLKEALIKGITTGSSQASRVDGYFKNPKIKIPFPPDVQRVEEKLRQIGMGNEVDKFVMTLNRGAEDAAKEAKPIFVNAIKSMTIQDAWGILKGNNDAATQYLIRTTSGQLKAKFKPVIKNSLDKVNATKYYGDIVTTYNKVPFVEKVNPDLDDYATDKAIEGLFYLVAQEEAKIRKDPLARTTDLLKKVFAAQD
ncbi:hypothetical protein C900_02624 [Fulvivirga imtechensis AK7]|uniref:DUF4197 domain-containing protein n=1 Tax=Fulvivirga imtechensis AK7 TaxID=1237149 RepID=L8K0T7_9BACT|nr:DUF4197 domain-containing protein [Fulvivirga imtechensis]ELR73539.1 hypothetical protein C900_02624 [Fulvivirga imtechensis AK7]